MTTKRFLVFVGLWLVALAASVREVSTQFDTPNRAFHNATAFRLEGRHLNVACEACHINGQYAGTPNTCFQCHWIRRKDDRYQLRLGSTCESCHRPTSWTAVTFNHAAVGGVPLGANHATIACDSCHKDAQFTGVAADCVSCHREDYQRATNPNHVTAGFPLTCDSCHRPNDAVWQSTGAAGGFSHAAIFPLVGVHATATCQSCHKNNVFRGTSRECVGCHQADYNATRSPNHATAGFPTTCDSCHRPTDPSWTGNGAAAGFNHNAVFALVGTHATQQCASCHQNNVYRGTARDCAGCHLNRYNATTAPNHAAAGFPTTCESCHRATDASWQSGSGGFNHNAVFALVGTHASQQCASCHRNNVYRGTARDCAGCHLNRYNATTAPAHAAAGFPTTCESCHRATDTRWTGVTFNHTPFFALQGVHATQQCASCHRNSVYRGTARTCAGCHLNRYNATTAPAHAAAGFPTTCESCHRATDARWTGVTFNHTPFFALQGIHATQQCASCHRNNVYRGTARTCAGCHLNRYNATTAPAHAAAGFPTTCESCHRATDSSWNQGRFTHTQFPLSGRHNVPCAQCHTTPNNYRVFSCTTCHTRSETDNEHRGRSGYVYDSNACYSCHPNGRGD